MTTIQEPNEGVYPTPERNNITYQFVLRTDGFPPLVMRALHYKEKAQENLDKYVEDGIRGCLCFLYKNSEHDYGMFWSQEF
jgi:hypothetical protein